MKRVLLVLWFSAAVVFAQDIPPAPPITQERILAQVGALQVRVGVYEEYVTTLQQRLRELVTENAQLKARLIELEQK